jgi:hypothetical protein
MFKQSAHGNALAAGAVRMELIDTLIDKQLFTRADAKRVVAGAAAKIKETNGSTVAGTEATFVIADLLGRYA